MATKLPSKKVWITCADPLLQHSKKIVKDKTFSRVTEDYARERRDCFPSLWENVKIKETWLCKLCVWKIGERHKKCVPVQEFSTLSLDTSELLEEDTSSQDFEDVSVDKVSIKVKLQKLGVDSDFLESRYISKKSAANCIVQLRKEMEFIINSVSKIAKISTVNEQVPTPIAETACKVCEDTIKNLASRFREMKSKEDKYKILTCAPSSLTLNQTTKVFGCSEYMARQANELKKTEGFYSCPSAKLGRSLPEHIKELVVQFYEDDENSRVDPSTRSAQLKKKGDSNNMVGQARRHILLSLADLYALFKEVHPEAVISISAFAKLRPSWCRFPGKRGHHLSCTCMVHENFKLLTTAMNLKLTSTQVVSALVCNKESEICCFNACSLCPKVDIVDGWFDAVSYEDITFNFWGNMQGYYGTNLFERTESKQDFKDRFLTNLPELLVHHFIMKKQYEYLEYVKQEILPKENSALVQIDFAQNYQFTIQDAVQGFHWNNNQATIHPFFFTWFDKATNKLISKSYVVISDHLVHDADTFFAFRCDVIDKVKSDGGLLFDKFYYVSDGAGSQYKNKKNFANLLLHENDSGIKAEWHFFPTSHGKGPCDGVGAVVKKICTIGSLKVDPKTKSQIYLRSADDIAKYAGEQLNSEKIVIIYTASSRVTSITKDKAFYSRYDGLKSVPGTRTYHSIIPSNEQSLQVRRFSLANEFKVVSLKMNNDKQQARFTANDYVGIKLGSGYAVGKIVDVDDGCFNIQLLKHRKRRNEFFLPENPAIQIFPEEQILLKLRHVDSVGNNYKLGSADYKTLESSVMVT